MSGARRASTTSPTQRTLARLRKQGMLCQVVERWISYPPAARKPGMPPGVRIDLFGFIDGIALDLNALPGHRIIGWQACRAADISAHLLKIQVECEQKARAWLEAGARIQVWGWRALKVERGAARVKWEPDVREVVIYQGRLINGKVEPPVAVEPSARVEVEA